MTDKTSARPRSHLTMIIASDLTSFDYGLIVSRKELHSIAIQIFRASFRAGTDRRARPRDLPLPFVSRAAERLVIRPANRACATAGR